MKKEAKTSFFCGTFFDMFAKIIPMKKKSYLILIISILLIFNLPSCIPEDEELNTGDPRDEVVGTWLCDENSPTFQHQVYDVGISKSSADSSEIKISNFFGLGVWSQTRAIYNSGQLVIPTQTLENYTITGTGTVSSDNQTINLQYIVTEVVSKKKQLKKIDSESVTAVYTKK
jgi:hypothetical protein